MNLRIGAKQHIQLADEPGFVPFARRDIEQSISQRFERQAETRAQSIALTGDGQSLAYGVLNAKANRLARRILTLGGDKLEPVVIFLGQGVDAVVAILASLKAGKIYVVLDPGLPPDRLRRTLAECGATLLLTDGVHMQQAHVIAGSSVRSMPIDQYAGDQYSSDACDDNLHKTIDCEQPCYIYYTSGSTGPSKGVVDCHRNVLHNVLRYTNSLKINPKDRLSLIQSFSFSGTVSTLFSGLLNGAEVHLFDLQTKGIERLAGWINRQKITIYHSVPEIFDRLVTTGQHFPSLRLIRLEGDRTEPHHLSRLKRNFDDRCVVVNGLGATETGLTRQFFMMRDTLLSGDHVPIGFAVEDMDVVLVDKDRRPIAQGEVGEIAICSRYLAQGYWRRPDLTNAAFETAPGEDERRIYYSGDLGRMDGTNSLVLLGRAPKARSIDRSLLAQGFEAPQGAWEKLVAPCVEQVLELDCIGRHDDLFDLGADSLKLTELFLLLEEKTGRVLSPDLALKASTIEALAKALSAHVDTNGLVTIQSAGSRPPLFCIHNYPGTVLEYGRLAEALGPDQPVYGLSRSGAPDGVQLTIEDMASAYIEQIKRLQPHGPYHICGNCFGGTIAFDVARQLECNKEEVGLLALIDTAFPAHGIRLIGRQFNLVRNWKKLGGLSASELIGFGLNRLKGLSLWLKRELHRRRAAQGRYAPLSVEDSNRLAEARYRPKSFEGDAVLYCLGRPHNHNGWRKVAKALRIVELPDHASAEDQPHIISEPFVSDLAQHLGQQIPNKS